MFFKNRQEKFPEEFRIDESDWDYQVILDSLYQEPPEEESFIDMDTIKDIILRVWRINNKTEQYKSNNNAKNAEKLVKANDEFSTNESKYVIKAIKDSLKPIKFINKQSKSIMNMLNENGFEIKNHTDSKYYGGMAVDVLVFETSDEVEESIITETIKPSIYYDDELILNGEVIVTTPPSDNKDNG